MEQSADLMVIGGGSAGFAAAIKAATAGRTVALIEAGVMGGTCVKVGCVPSKTLIAALNLRWRALNPPVQGLGLRGEAMDAGAVFAHKQALVETLREERYRQVLAAYPTVRWVEGAARIEAAEPAVRVRVGETVWRAPRCIVATGSRPWILPISGLAGTPYWTSTEALSPTAVPSRLLVLGGGAVGIELGQLYHRLGSAVTVVEASERLLPREDPEVSAVVTKALGAEGMTVCTGAAVDRVTYSQERFTVEGRTAEGHFQWVGEAVLVAAGRRPNLAGLGLAEVGVALNARGGIAVDERMQSSVATIYAAGDAECVYVAAEAGSVAATHALGLGDRRIGVVGGAAGHLHRSTGGQRRLYRNRSRRGGDFRYSLDVAAVVRASRHRQRGARGVHQARRGIGHRTRHRDARGGGGGWGDHPGGSLCRPIRHDLGGFDDHPLPLSDPVRGGTAGGLGLSPRRRQALVLCG